MEVSSDKSSSGAEPAPKRMKHSQQSRKLTVKDLQCSDDELPDHVSDNEMRESETQSQEASSGSQRSAHTEEPLKDLSSGKSPRKVSLPSSPSTEPIESPIPLKSSWFRSKDSKRLYFESFESKPVVPCELFDKKFMASQPLFNIFFECGASSLFDLPKTYYPRLVRLFFANLSFSSDKSNPVLKTKVMETDITLSIKDFSKILGFPLSFDKKIIPSGRTMKSKAYDLFKRETLESDNRKSLTYKSMFPEAQVIYYVVVRTILLKYNSIEFPNSLAQELVLHLMKKKKVPLTLYIFQHMAKSLNAKENSPLPFANLITLILNHFSAVGPGEEAEEITRVTDKNHMLHFLPLEEEEGILFVKKEEDHKEENQKGTQDSQKKDANTSTNVQDQVLIDADSLNLLKKLVKVQQTLEMLLKSSNRIGDLIETFVKPASSKGLTKFWLFWLSI